MLIGALTAHIQARAKAPAGRYHPPLNRGLENPVGCTFCSRKPLLPASALRSQHSARSAKPAKAGRRPKTTPASSTSSAKKPLGCLGRTLKWGAGLIVVLVACGALANLAPRTATHTTPTAVPVTLAPVTVPAATDTPVSADAQRAAASVALEAATAAPTEPATATPLPTLTPSPTATPPPTPVPTHTTAPTIPSTPAGPVANTAANVREGPSLDAAVVITAQAGQPLMVTGQDSSGQWLQLASGYWIAAVLVDGAPFDLPVTAADAQLPGGNPTPAPTTSADAPAPTPSWQREERGVVFTSECPCDQGDVLNCGDFGIDMDAQACYLRCMDLVGRDVHGLDGDKDGGACEWNW